jgi:hypothetical protein
MKTKRGFHAVLAAVAMFAGTLFANPAPAAAAEAAVETLQLGREMSQLFLDGDTAAAWARFSPDMQAAMTADALAAFREQVAAQLGSELSIVSEDTQQTQGVSVYVRTSRWSLHKGDIVMQWAFDAEGRAAGFFVRPAAASAPAASRHLERDTLARLRLPFDGEWLVVWGGRTLEQNYHAAHSGQRFAYDLVRVVDGARHLGDGRAVEQYHCWDQPILAPASGRVVGAVGDLPDQAIGTTNASQPAGNHVMLDLGRNEYMLLAHLRQGSLEVATGDTVAAGQPLGRCGNSGNTSEPHLHMHLQDAPVFGQGEGLPAFFNGYLADGRHVDRGEPLQGQTVRAH